MGTEVMAGKNPGWEVESRLVPGGAEDAQSAQGFWGERVLAGQPQQRFGGLPLRFTATWAGGRC